MWHRLLEPFGLSVLAFLVSGCAFADKPDADECIGQIIEGPWFSFLLPEGMSVDTVVNGEITESSVWLKSQVKGSMNAFFLFAPRHGGKAYPIFLGASETRKLVEFDTENGETVKYIISYDDGSIGLYEGNSQRITGFRVGVIPLGQTVFAQ